MYLDAARRELSRQPAGRTTIEERLTAATLALNNHNDSEAARLAADVLNEDGNQDLAEYLLAVVAARGNDVTTAIALTQLGLEPVMQVVCRDKNRLALQADIVGATMFGVENFCALTGDDVTAGDEPEARRVFDLDGPQLVQVMNGMRSGSYLSGRAIEPAPRMFIGAVENETLMLNGIQGFAAISAAVAAYRAKNPDQPVVVATAVAHGSFGEGTPITRELLDRIVSDRPFIAVCFDHHTVWANTKADRKSTRLNSSHVKRSRMPSSA